MNITEVLQFADELVFANQGKHLDDSQEVVVKGVWEGKTYEEIAEQSNRSERHVRDIGYKLWKILSEQLGEDIKKSNFRSTLERVYIKSSKFIGLVNHHNFHFCTQTFNQSNNNRESAPNNKSKLIYHDLALAPQIIKFYNRETEFKKLDKWIFNQDIGLISVLGLPGIGKTTLVKRFVDLNLEQFEVVIWKSLQFPKPLTLLVSDFLNVCQEEVKETLDDKLKQLFDIFTEKRCLIILDDVQNIFISGQFAGQYQSEYKKYQKFFTTITETQHQSNLILISQDKCAEMCCLDEELYYARCLELSGLDDVKIFNNTGLKDEESWSTLIKLYEGNPLYLKIIANSIKNIFNGYVAEFLDENELIITKDIQINLQLLFNKLSSKEQQIVLKLSNFDQPVYREDLKACLELSSTDFISSLESLQQRYLVAKIKGDRILFKLSPVFREYVKNCCKD
ncbi:MAG: AAA family ATPase [Moorea sp. SIO2B7]|nr:AAA family ATPase [Moorena sp. SIO2B7]